MKHFLFSILLFFSASLSAQESPNHLPNELVLKFTTAAEENYQQCFENQRFDHPFLDQLNRSYELESIRLTANKSRKNTLVLKFKEEQNLNVLIEKYMESGLFEYAEPNYIGQGHGKMGVSKVQTTPNDLYFFRQYGLYNDGSFALSTAVADADVDMEQAWDIEQGDSNIIVAVLDGGIIANHPELSGRLWINRNESNDGLDTDLNGYADDFMGWNFANDDNDLTDEFGHGTNVAGIIGSNGDNNIGYAGIDWNCKLMVLKVLDTNNFGLYTWWAEAVHYAVDHGSQVINMSLGGTSPSQVLEDACQYAYDNDVTVIVSSGNNNSSQVFYPSVFASTIAVGATDADDSRVSPFFWDPNSGSSYGNHIDVVAPGNYIYGLNHLSINNYSSYWGGTSQAAPLVAGLCALLMAQDGSRTPDDLRNILRNTAEDEVGDPNEDVPGFDIYHGYGRVNASAALGNSVISTSENSEVEFNLNTFPNPATDQIQISIENPPYGTRLVLVNLLGNTLWEKEVLHSENILMDVSSYSAAEYVLQLISLQGEPLATKKVVIN